MLDGKKTLMAVIVGAAGLLLFMFGAIDQTLFEQIIAGSGILAVFGIRDAIAKK